MSIFGTFTSGRELTDAERRWNRMWDLWAEGEAESPWAELMTYDSEVNNGGHFQYFFNTDNCGDLAGEIRVLLDILPEPLGDEEMILCDQFLYENEQPIMDILKTYAESL